MKRNEAFPSKYLAQGDCEPAIIATIEDLNRELLKGRDDEPDETKTIMYFAEETVKPLVLNNINWLTCEDLYGEDSDSWKGKKIELYRDPNIMFGSKRVGGIRIRPAKVATDPTEGLYTNTSKLAPATVAKWTELVKQGMAAGVVMNYKLDESDTPEVLADRVKAVKAAIAENQKKLDDIF